MAKNKKSHHYNDFKSHKVATPSDPRSVFKKVWKWIKIVLIIIFATVGMVGCVQSFAIKTSNKVGSGYEIYTSEKYVSPNVYTLRYDNSTNTFINGNTNDNIKYNKFLGIESPETIEKIKKQDQETGGKYLNYNGSTFALQLIAPDKDNEDKFVNVKHSSSTDASYVYNDGTNYAYFNFGDDKGAGKTEFYTPLTTFERILLPTKVEFFTSKENNETISLNNRLKAITISEILPTLPVSAIAEDIFVRDALQIVINETLKMWVENDTLKIKSIIEGQQGKTVLEKVNAYLETFKDKVSETAETDKGLTKEEGLKFNNFALAYRLAFERYMAMFNYVLGNKTSESNYRYYVPSSVSPLGNYNENNGFRGIINPNEMIPQKALATYGDYWAQGPFYGMFVYPINQFMQAITHSLGTTGWSIILALILTVILVRLITFFISFKSLFMQSKLEELNQKKAKIEAKYAEYKNDKKMQQRKQLEISELYKKEKVSPFGQIITMLITLPILIVIFRIISASPEIKYASWYGIQMSASSIQRLIAKEYIYLPIIIFSVGIQALAQYTPKLLNRKKNKALRIDAYEQAAVKKSNRTNNIISLVFIFIGVIFSAGLQIYWIISGIWTIVQAIFVHYFQRTKFFKNKIEPKFFN
ncbi:Oxa1Ec [Metamycoplasma cloacale]|uniref:Membrane protein insertase YidC n=1 Tax=Metamycoplasma cloacale TaxID=92401 RepID=A0A2Z4LLN8_9BACT|nr:membrane protein insertase YidC [Metamycoplasma cloacale]AWX42626.1 membrane protein insertase YidC [Metamycoplasma cloacale]VEU79610.1 Oxa1Ec [Metamycoplasma cloacale]